MKAAFGKDKMATINGTQYNDNNTWQRYGSGWFGFRFFPQINGTDSSDTIYALGGNDIVDAKGGDDTVYGGAGNDTIIGGSGLNTLNGGTGDDLLDARSGFNTLTGGSGRDVFFLSTTSYGHITDFEDGVDRIRGLDFNSVDIYQFGNNTIITNSTRTIAYGMLADIDASLITAADFIA